MARALLVREYKGDRTYRGGCAHGITTGVIAVAIRWHGVHAPPF